VSVVIVSVVVALLVAAAIVGIVVVGIRGDLPEVSERAPELAGRFEWAARKLNGDQPNGSDADLGPLPDPAPAAEPPAADPQATRMIPTLRSPGRAVPPQRPDPVTRAQRRSTLPPTGDFGAM